jgi:glycine cleavage system H protein
MSTIPDNLRYTVEHEWVRDEGDGVFSVGITDYAQDALGDITYLELPEPGTALSSGDTFGVVESVKTFSDLYAPLAGEVVEANAAALDAPESVNEDAYGVWLIKVKTSDPGAFGALLSAEQYGAHVEESG